MTNNIYNSLLKPVNKKKFAVLIDPDKPLSVNTVKIAEEAKVDYFFVGGSLLTKDHLNRCLDTIKENSSIPTTLFPGNTMQISNKADALLFLSLISGRNPEMLIGKHVIAAPYLKESKIEIIPTGYMLIDSGRVTSVQYMSNTAPIPSDKNEIAMCTAVAGEMLGLKLIYMDAGSGASKIIEPSMIKMVKKNISLPLIVGGGIKTPTQAETICKAGADVVVVGNAIENNAEIISEIADAIHNC